MNVDALTATTGKAWVSLNVSSAVKYLNTQKYLNAKSTKKYLVKVFKYFLKIH